MTKLNVPDRVLNEIVAFAERHAVERVVLFGSRARGSHTRRSDVDLAVQGGDFDAFYWDVKEKTHSLLSFDVVEDALLHLLASFRFMEGYGEAMDLVLHPHKHEEER